MPSNSDEKIRYRRVNYKIPGIALMIASVLVLYFAIIFYQAVQYKQNWLFRSMPCFLAVLAFFGYGLYCFNKENNIRSKIDFLKKFGQKQIAQVVYCTRYRNRRGCRKTSWLDVKLLHSPAEDCLISDDYWGDLSILQNHFVSVYMDIANPKNYYVDVNSYSLKESACKS